MVTQAEAQTEIGRAEAFIDFLAEVQARVDIPTYVADLKIPDEEVVRLALATFVGRLFSKQIL